MVWLLPLLALGCAVAVGGFAHLALIALTVALGPWLLREISGREFGAVPATVAVSRAAVERYLLGPAIVIGHLIFATDPLDLR